MIKLARVRKTFRHKTTRAISGLGDGVAKSTEGAVIGITFQDGKRREIECTILEEVPHDIIIGLPFMVKHDISFIPGRKEFKLMDMSKQAIIASSSGITATRTNKVRVAEIKTPDKPVVIEKQTQPKHASLNPVWQKAFDCNLKPNLKLDVLLNKLCHDGEFVIDDSHLDENRKNFPDYLRSHNCYFASKSPHAEEYPVEALAVQVERNSKGEVIKGTEPYKLTPEQKKQLDDLLEKYKDIFATTASDVGKANFDPWVIKLVNKEPVALKNYRTPLQYRDWLKKELQNLLDGGIIECSESPYNSPVLVVPKKLDVNQDTTGTDPTASQGARLVIDYRQVNKIIEDANYPIPRIQDIITEMGGCDVFSTMDIRHAFYTIEIHPDSRKVTAFSCEFGKYQFKFLPQGLKISPAVFQQKISLALAPYQHTNAYIDDISTATKGFPLHFSALEDVFIAMRKNRFKLKKGKCLFLYVRVPVVGHMVSGQGVSIEPDKIKAVERLRPPNTVSEVRSLMGFVNFLREHVPHFADVVAPIQDLVSKAGNKSGADVTPYWDDRCDLSLRTIKDLLVSNEVLAYPNKERDYELFTDASGKHMSGVLMQKDDNGNRRPIGYFARSFMNTQVNWAALTKEAYAVYRSVEFFKVFITGCKVILRCDHKPLHGFINRNTNNQMVNRWSLNIQQYNITFEWVATDENISDCLSRLLSSGLYVPHEPIKTDFDPFPKKSQVVEAAEQDHGSKAQVRPTSKKVQKDKVLVTAMQDPSQGENGENQAQLVALPRPISNVDMKKLQDRDAYCDRVKKLLGLDQNMSEMFTIKEGLLYRVVVSRERPACLALVIPPKLALSVIASVHTELVHPGSNKMLDSLRYRVYWRGMAKQIRAFVAGCATCILRTLKQDSYPFKHSGPPLRPWNKLAMDFAGSGYGVSKDGNVAVFTVMCLHSQYPFAVPVKDKTASSAVIALNQVLAQVNNVSEILSDNGPEMTSEEMKTFLEGKGIKHRFTAPYCPQANGVLERWHGFMNNVVRLCDPVRQDNSWEQAVTAALKAYRCIPHASSGFSPHYLVYGETPVLDLDKMLPTLRISHKESGVADKLQDQLSIAFGLARKNVCLSRQKNSNSKVRLPEKPIQVGDLVVMKDNTAKKGQSPWKIGYKVVELLSERSARVVNIKSGKKYKVGMQHLKHADPLALLLDNSQIDLFPGRTRLYMPAQDLPDLNWPAEENLPQLGELNQKKLIEATRDRTHDRGEQDPTDELGTSVDKKDVKRSRKGRIIIPKKRPDFVYFSTMMSANLVPHILPKRGKVLVVTRSVPQQQ